MQTQELTKIDDLTSDVFDVASEPHISIDFKKDGEPFFVEIAALDALNFLKAAGRYAYERFVSNADGNYYVIELQGEGDYEVRVKIEDRLKSFNKVELEAIVKGAFNDSEYVNAIYEPYEK